MDAWPMDAWPMVAWPMNTWPMDRGCIHQFSDKGRMHKFPHAKKIALEGDIRQTDGHRDSMIESAQWADSMKISF